MNDRLKDDFQHWFARNHPWDWFAKENGGSPISALQRLHYWFLCRAAYMREDVPRE